MNNRGQWGLFESPLSWWKKNKLLISLSLGLITIALLVGLSSPRSMAKPPQDNPPANSITSEPQASNSSPTGKKLYEMGRFAEAAQVLQAQAQDYQSQGKVLQQAMTLSNLALTYQKLGLWSDAQEAVAESLQLLQANQSSASLDVIAQTLNIKGSLQLSQGQAESALHTWQQAATIYAQVGNELGELQSQINQAQALQTLGFYRRALKLLDQIESKLAGKPDSVTQAVGWRSLGDVLQLIGDLDASRHMLEQSLAVAQQIQSPQQISAALFSLGNTARAQGKVKDALSFYQQAADTTTSPTIQVQIQLNQLSLLISKARYPEAREQIEIIESGIDKLPPSRNSIYARIKLAQSLAVLDSQGKTGKGGTYSPARIAQHLAKAIQQAKDLGDRQAESYGLGALGNLYEQKKQWQEAQKLTQKALLLSQTINAPDLSYRWQWQLGRLLNQQGNDRDAIAAYDSAITILKSLRSDLVTINPDVQFSFRESVEPVYRELVSLLLKEQGNKTAPEKLEKARKVIESLQLAELDNFFRSACLNAKPVQIDQVDQNAAVIYPIILPDRLEVILSIPQQPLRHYATYSEQAEIESTVKQLRRTITNSLRQTFLPSSEQIYDWLISPLEADLARSGVKTLVFVLDGSLRNIPMAALYDGKKYLAEKYSIAVTPGLELLESRSLERGKLKVLTVGLSEGRQGFNPLPGVEEELEQIQTRVNTEVLLNQEFTEPNVQTAMGEVSFPVVHFATHGKFSSVAEDTFILTWDGQINVNELNGLLKTTDLGNSQPIELLVFSACETATGDSRAALGIAGVAVRAGARSTMASLWSVNDRATAEFMVRFYQELANPEVTKAEALRRAQMSILQNPKYRHHPYFWAPFIMVGNWL